jgi:hypothetical protein
MKNLDSETRNYKSLVLTAGVTVLQLKIKFSQMKIAFCKFKTMLIQSIEASVGSV